MESTTVRFGEFEFDRRTRELRRGAERVHLAPKPSIALGLLVARAGSLVTREEFRDAVWPGTVIEFDQGLNTCMRHLRAALGDDAAQPTYIETVPRRGYRFIAPVEVVSGAASGSRPLRAWALVIATLASVAAGVWVFATPARSPSTDRPPLLAVLPFDPIGGTREDSAFADGLAEEILTSLAAANPERLRVLARTSSYRIADGFTLEELRRTFGIDLVLEGRVRREAGGYKVTAQLVDTRSATALWSGASRHSVDAAPVGAQERFSAVLAAGLGELIGFSPTSVVGPTPRSEVATSWRVARHLLEGRTSAEKERALALMQGVLGSDPLFVPAHEARARALLDLGRTDQGEEAIARSVAAVGVSPGLLLERGRLRLRQWRLDEAGRDLAEAVRRAPHLARAHHSHGYYLSVSRRHGEALEAMRRAGELDPVSESVVGDAGLFSFWARRPQAAIERCESIRPYALPEYRLMLTRCLLYSYAALGLWDQALQNALVVMEAAGASEAERRAVLEGAAPGDGVRAYFAWAADPARLAVTQGGDGSYRRAIAAAMAGDIEAALEALEEAFAEREPRLIEIGVEPRLDVLRDEDRFGLIAASVGVGVAPEETTQAAGD